MFKSIGFVISLIAVRIFLPVAFHAFEATTVQFFGFAGEIFSHPPTAIFRDLGTGPATSGQTAGMSYIPKPAPMPDFYPMNNQGY